MEPQVTLDLLVDVSDPNTQVLHDVAHILTGFFRVGILSNDENKLRLYTDDGNTVEYDDKFDIDSIVNFVLTNTNSVIQARSKVANDVKANK